MRLQTTYLSWFQVIEFTASSFFPLTFWLFPRIAVVHARTDAQWAVLGVVLVGLLIGWVHALLNERFPTMTGADMTRTLWGRWLGTACDVAYFPVYVLFNAMCVFLFALVVKSFFPHTPRVVLIVGLCLVAMRGAYLGVESLGRVASIVHPVTLAGVIIIFCFIIFQAEHFWLPSTVENWNNTFEGVYYLLPIFLGVNTFLMISPYYKRKRRRSVYYPVISILAGGVAILCAYFAVVLNTGVYATGELSFPIPFVIQLLRFQGNIVERVGIMIVLFATAYTVLFVSNTTWGLSTLSARIFNLPDGHYRYFVLPVTIVNLLVACSIRSDQQAFEVLNGFLVPMSWILLVLLPVGWLTTAIIRRKRTEPETSTPSR